jgi:hypothetical protein
LYSAFLTGRYGLCLPRKEKQCWKSHQQQQHRWLPRRHRCEPRSISRDLLVFSLMRSVLGLGLDI